MNKDGGDRRRIKDYSLRGLFLSLEKEIRFLLGEKVLGSGGGSYK